MGYPSLPDQLLISSIDQLLGMSQIGIELTENGAMSPTASVSGLYIAHPASSYFMVGRVGDDQLKEYAERRRLPEAVLRSAMSRLLKA